MGDPRARLEQRSDGPDGVAARPPRAPLGRLGSSLRARLTAAFAGIIVVTLLLAGSAFVLILQEYQIRRETNRVAELTLPVSNQVRSLEQLGASTQDIVDFLDRQAEDLDLQIVLADTRGLVFADSEGRLVGRQLQIQGPPRFGIQRRVRQATVQGPDGEVTMMVSPAVGPPAANPAASPAPAPSPAPPAGPTIGERFLGRASAYVVGLSIPRQTLATAWLELLPRLSLAALVALLLSIAVAWPLAASIARPLARMTEAAERIARGRYETSIEVRGRDEVARLAQTFNRMASEVSASHRAMRDLLANVSHDLRTPLTSIQGFSQALTDGTLSEPGRAAEAGRVINQEAARMGQLIDDLLYLSRMDSGQARLELAPVELGPLLADRLAPVARRAAEAGITLRWVPGAAPPVLADRARLERVFDNLLDNALRHTPPGGTVTVETGADRRRAGGEAEGRAGRRQPRAPTAAGAGAAARVSIHNTGSFIPPDDLPRVFERFYQVDKARSAGGSGLGLAISRETVQAHGGRCWVESDPTQGTRFWVELPAAQPGEADPARSGGPARAATSV